MKRKQENHIADAVNGNSIFKLRNTTNKPDDHPLFVAIRNQTSQEQERDVYQSIWDMCCHDNLPSDHLLVKYDHAMATSKIYELYGRCWAHTVLDIYTGYQRKRSHGARMAVEVICIDGGDLRALFRRYGDLQVLRDKFYWANHHQEYGRYCLI
jgi:hypothetical protein